MLVIRGDTRVADFYLTELTRLLEHFIFRDELNQAFAKAGKATTGSGAVQRASPEAEIGLREAVTRKLLRTARSGGRSPPR